MTSTEDIIYSYTPPDSDSDYEIESVTTRKHHSFIQRLFKRDRRRFNKYIQSSTIHGVVHIFFGKSKIRRLLWLLIVLSSTIGCVQGIVNHIIHLSSGPTDTPVSVLEPGSDGIDFPAVTVCNMNLIKKSFLDNYTLGPSDPEMSTLIQKVYALDHENNLNTVCDNHLDHDVSVKSYESLSELLWNGRHKAEEMIFSCKFIGLNCSDVSEYFSPTFTQSGGVCYTFNGKNQAMRLKINGTGTRFALTLEVYISQDEYSITHNYDAGIKIAVHPQSEPPQPDELGIAVAPGKNAFISVRQTNVENKSSKRRCKEASDTTSFNFLQGEFPYSVSACQIDCLSSNIAHTCNCNLLEPGMAQTIDSMSKSFRNLSNCTISVKDICCLANEASKCKDSSACDCARSCKSTYYETSTSYSQFPAKYGIDKVVERLKERLNVTTNLNISRENLIRANIFFKTLTVQEEITKDTYNSGAFLSDIGGVLALFLGGSVISIIELFMWLFDEMKDRCCGVGERKLKKRYKTYLDNFKTRFMMSKLKPDGVPVESETDNHHQSTDNYTSFDSMQ